MKQIRLEDGLEVLLDHRGKTPKKLGADFVNSGVPVASAIMVTGGKIELSEARFVSSETFERWMPVRVRKGDVLLTSEAPLGRVARVESDEPLVLGQRLYGLRGKTGILDSGYLYYVLQTDRVQSDLVGRSTGTTVFGIRQSALRDVIIPTPAYSEQRAIAEVLGALDDKIAANTRLATTADELIRSKFDQLTFASTELLSFGDLATDVRDKAEPPFEAGQYVGLEHVPRRNMWLDAHGDVGQVTSTKSRFQCGDVLFGKLRPYFHKVASAPFDGVASTDILVVRPNESRLGGFVLAAASSDALVERAVSASEGTRMPRTHWRDLASWQVRWPGERAAMEFSREVASIRDIVESRLRENHALAATRDTLLPQLMSGKLRVREAAEMAGL